MILWLAYILVIQGYSCCHSVIYIFIILDQRYVTFFPLFVYCYLSVSLSPSSSLSLRLFLTLTPFVPLILIFWCLCNTSLYVARKHCKAVGGAGTWFRSCLALFKYTGKENLFTILLLLKYSWDVTVSFCAGLSFSKHSFFKFLVL